MKKTLFSVCCLVYGCVLFVSSLFAQQSAEIININYKYKIAFADLTEKDVKPGDMVAVNTSTGEQVYLKVVEAYPVMVKLMIADEPAYKLTDEMFGSIVVGGGVVVGNAGRKKAVPTVNAVKAPVKVEAEVVDEDIAHVESYTPTASRETVLVEKKIKRPAVVVPAPVQETVEMPSVPVAAPAVPNETNGCQSRLVMVEKRLDQVMNNNVSMSETVTVLIADKNTAEEKARVKEADAVAAKQKLDETLSARRTLEGQLKTAQADLLTLRSQKESADKEIQSLNVKLVELKKKLARMVEIINNNVKAYE
jgi:hypothetical protein